MVFAVTGQSAVPGREYPVAGINGHRVSEIRAARFYVNADRLAFVAEVRIELTVR